MEPNYCEAVHYAEIGDDTYEHSCIGYAVHECAHLCYCGFEW